MMFPDSSTVLISKLQFYNIEYTDHMSRWNGVAER